MSQRNTETESIIFEYSEEGPGSYTIMCVRLLELPGEGMSGGFVEGQHIWMLLGGGVQMATNDKYRFSNFVVAEDDDNLWDIMSYIQDSSLDEFKAMDGILFEAPVEF